MITAWNSAAQILKPSIYFANYYTYDVAYIYTNINKIVFRVTITSWNPVAQILNPSIYFAENYNTYDLADVDKMPNPITPLTTTTGTIINATIVERESA